MKVVSLLTRLGYLEAQRGPGGGIRLARKPSEINLADVIRDTEEDLDMVECFSSQGNCVLSPECRLQSIIQSSLDAFLGTLEKYTLQDLVQPAGSLGMLLNIPESDLRHG